MTFRFRKYGRAGAVLLAMGTAACHRAPMFTTPVTTTIQSTPPVEPDPPVTTGVSEALAVARKATISGIAYNLNLVIPEKKAEPIEVDESVSFYLKDNRHPVQLDFKAATSHLRSLTVNGQPVALDHRNEHLVLPTAVLQLGHNVAEIRFKAGEKSLNRNDDYLYTLLVPTVPAPSCPSSTNPI